MNTGTAIALMALILVGGATAYVVVKQVGGMSSESQKQQAGAPKDGFSFGLGFSKFGS